MEHYDEPDWAAATPPDSTEPVVIDCDDCAVRGPGCRDCVVSVILGVPETLLEDERVALDVSPTPDWHRDCGWCPFTASGPESPNGVSLKSCCFLNNSELDKLDAVS
jgi:hypothetical protein